VDIPKEKIERKIDRSMKNYLRGNVIKIPRHLLTTEHVKDVEIPLKMVSPHDNVREMIWSKEMGGFMEVKRI
jgi:hypothetical protein